MFVCDDLNNYFNKTIFVQILLSLNLNITFFDCEIDKVLRYIILNVRIQFNGLYIRTVKSRYLKTGSTSRELFKFSELQNSGQNYL
jgi:hypothetical protein